MYLNNLVRLKVVRLFQFLLSAYTTIRILPHFPCALNHTLALGAQPSLATPLSRSDHHLLHHHPRPHRLHQLVCSVVTWLCGHRVYLFPSQPNASIFLFVFIPFPEKSDVENVISNLSGELSFTTTASGLRCVLLLSFCVVSIWTAYISQGILQENLSNDTAIDISGSWVVAGAPLDLSDPRLLAMAAAERHLLESEYDEYADNNANGAAFCRSAALILMALLLLRHALTVTNPDGDEDDVSTFFSVPAVQLFLLRAAGFPSLLHHGMGN